MHPKEWFALALAIGILVAATLIGSAVADDDDTTANGSARPAVVLGD